MNYVLGKHILNILNHVIFFHENTNIDVSVFMLDLRMINMSPAEPEYEVWWRVSEANESQTSYSVEQANIFQYQSYSHSDDMLSSLNQT
jgi:hypothetical protein